MSTQPTGVEPQRISDYERAVCYYALSRPTGNVTLALILVYGLCLLEALAALIYGLVSGDPTWTTVGTWALAGIIILGVVAFTWRALRAEIQRREAVKIAAQAPDPEEIKGLPDPFAQHILLRRPLDEGEESFVIHDRDGQAVYTVRLEDGGTVRCVIDRDGDEHVRITIPVFRRSFALEGMLPRRAEVHCKGEPVAAIRQRFSLGAPTVDIVEGRGRDVKRFVLREGGLYQEGRLMGRIYLLRDSAFLDVEESAMGCGLLGLFVALSYEKAHTVTL